MALTPPPISFLFQPKNQLPSFALLHSKPSSQTVLKHSSRRSATVNSAAALLMMIISSTSSLNLAAKESLVALALDLRLTAPDQTVEEAESGIKGHAQSLLQVKALFESSSSSDGWREAQKELRKRASYLKQDIYTIIQSKPGGERPQLRKLYSILFNSVTALDFAARDKDTARVWQSYTNIVDALNHILSII